MFDNTQRIFKEAAGLFDKAKHAFSGKGRYMAGGAAVIGAAPLYYDKAMDISKDLFSLARRTSGVSGLISDADYNSSDAKHRRTMLRNAKRYAERKAQQLQLNNP